MRALLLPVVLAAACSHPAAKPDIPCSSSGECPTGQMCDFSRTPAVCTNGGLDAGGADAPPVACTTDASCPAAAPVCDPSGVCRGCAADAECGAGVCHELTGSCVAEADTLYVSPAGADAGSSCARAQ